MGFPAVRLETERRPHWAADALKEVLPFLGPTQQPLFSAETSH